MPSKKTADGSSKKQKKTTDIDGAKKRRAIGTSPYKNTRKRLTRRTSSSDPGLHKNPNTPTFRQPPQQDPRPIAGSSQNHANPTANTRSSQDQVNVNLGRTTREVATNNEDEENEGDGREPDDEDGDGEELTRHMRRLSGADRYAAIGKAFSFKYWPWPDTNWWVDDGETGALEEEPGRVEQEARALFSQYLEVLSIEEAEWRSRSFRTPVIVPFLIREPNLTASL